MIRFDSRDGRYKMPFGAVREGQRITFSIDFSRTHGAYKVRVVIFADDGSGWMSVPMRFVALNGDVETYRANTVVETAGLYWYRFEYEKPADREGPAGLVKIGRGEGRTPVFGCDDSWQLTVFEKNYETPAFMKGGVMYQIFPDRFRRSKKYKPVIREDSHLREDWGGTPELIRDEAGNVPNNDFFGGNLDGIQEKLEYLSSLGVNLIYLNPIFEAASNHKYDTGDYEKIDGVFGTEESFESLCRSARDMGIRVILDGVFNHTGADSKYFNKYGRYDSIGAYQSQESPYYNWYHFTQWPDEYEAWWGVKILPQVNERNNDYCEYITGENGIVEKWLRKGASGYRLDVADELPDAFLDRLRARVKKHSPEHLIIGEVWEDASNKISYSERRRYLQGKQLDSVMNYVFKDAMIAFLSGGSGKSLAESVESVVENYPKPSVDCLMNVLGTHDTARILTTLGGGAIGEEKLRLGTILQYFLPGVPCVFYGDEAGLEGEGDPFCRGCYPWGKVNKKLLYHYRKLGKIRGEYGCILAEGDYRTIIAQENLFGFLRVMQKDSHKSAAGSTSIAGNSSTAGNSSKGPSFLAVFVNRGNDDIQIDTGIIEETLEATGLKSYRRHEIKMKYKDLLSGRNVGDTPVVKAKSAIILSER